VPQAGQHQIIGVIAEAGRWRSNPAGLNHAIDIMSP
jgi:hypothetical protein